MQHLRIFLIVCLAWLCGSATAQELNATIDINTQHIQGTNKNVFDNLKTTLTGFMNERHWTDLKYDVNERIKCSISIVVNKYNEDTGLMTCDAYIQGNRPVFNSTYTTTLFIIHDANFNFTYHEFDQLDFRIDQIDNDLTALLAYYAYLIIGFDLDTMAPSGGSDVLQMAYDVANNAQNLNSKGWKAFEDNSNRFGIINDCLEAGMKQFRELQYVYHREGLDQMAENPEKGREAITKAIELLGKAYQAKSRSALPRLFSEYKRNEIVGIYKGQETSAKKQAVFDILTKINASQSEYWKQLMK